MPVLTRRRLTAAVVLALVAAAGVTCYLLWPAERPTSAPVALVPVEPPPPPGRATGRHAHDGRGRGAFKKTQVAVAKSEFVVRAAMRSPKVAELRRGRTPEWLTERVTVGDRPGSQVIAVGVTGVTQADAAVLADAVAEAFVQEARRMEATASAPPPGAVVGNADQDGAVLNSQREALGRKAATSGGAVGQGGPALPPAALYQERAGLRVEVAKAKADGKPADRLKPLQDDLAAVGDRIASCERAGPDAERAEVARLRGGSRLQPVRVLGGRQLPAYRWGLPSRMIPPPTGQPAVGTAACPFAHREQAMSQPPPRRGRWIPSRDRYREFVGHYKRRKLDDTPEADTSGPESPTPSPALTRRDHLRAYLRWLLPHKAAVIGVLLLSLVVAGLEMVEPLFMRFMVDRVLLATDSDPDSRLLMLNLAGATFLAVVVVSKTVGVFKDYRLKLLNAKVVLSLRRALYDRILKLPLPRLWEMKTGGILSRLSGDVDTTAGLLQMGVVSPTLALTRLAVAVTILLTLNWRLAVTALAIIPGAMLASYLFASRVRPIFRAVRKDVEALDGRAGEAFAGIRVVRAFGREGRELLDYLLGRHTVLRKELFAQRRELLLWAGWGLLVGGVSVVIVWFGGYLAVTGRASVGDVMAFQWYTFLLLGPVWTIVNSFAELQRSLAATERVFEVLATPADKPDRPDAIDAPAVVSEVRFEGVEFEYRSGRPVVKDFSVAVPGGSVVALVGRSGAGKTTVTDLVARFHDPTRGRILVNGVDVRDYRLRAYRGLLALVQQDVFLFDGSVRENIAYGRPDATPAEVADAARRANAEEFIVKLPGGYETVVGERGVKLSGGQQQRLAIARAILADPQILILDEATSNLDTESEQLIQAAMGSLLAGRTTFVIAHRLSTVRRADLILLLEDGRVTERGTHAELMAAGGVYAGMVERQVAGDHPGEPF